MSNSDSELEEDEEEILVFVEFDNCATNDVFSSENLQLDMLGLDSDHPVMQVNGKFFEGTYEDAVGTYMFFENDNNPIIDDPVFDKIPTIKYFAKTRKVLKMQRAFISPRYEIVGDSEHNKCIPNMDTLKEAGVPVKYQEEALSFWENERNKRVQALHDYLKKQEFRKELRQRGFEPESESDEDNPFAMYKYADNESEFPNDNKNSHYDLQIEKLENSLQMTELDNEDKEKEPEKAPKKLTVIDPGPSTSKSSMPWVEEDVSNQDLMYQKVKSVGKVIKGRVQKKATKKKKFSTPQKKFNEECINQTNEVTYKDLETLISKDNDKSIESNLVVNTEQHKTNENEKMKNIKIEEMEIDDVMQEESIRLLSEELNLPDPLVLEKLKKKQERREAKMKEISERIKSLQQHSELPNS